MALIWAPKKKECYRIFKWWHRNRKLSSFQIAALHLITRDQVMDILDDRHSHPLKHPFFRKLVWLQYVLATNPGSITTIRDLITFGRLPPTADLEQAISLLAKPPQQDP